MVWPLLALLLSPVGAEDIVKTTVVQTRYKIDSRFEPVLRETVEKLRRQLRAKRAEGKLIAFVSIPLSARGGGNYALNSEVAEAVKKRLETRYGPEYFWALAPGLVESSLPEIGGRRATGSEYMYMWTEVLAGEQGLGEDFDLIYFCGPTDFGRFFGFDGEGDLEKLKLFMTRRAEQDPDFARTVSTPEQRRAFLRYYGFSASVAASTGAHDEWNLFRRVNERRREKWGVARRLPFYFDGQMVAPPVCESPVTPGYEFRGGGEE